DACQGYQKALVGASRIFRRELDVVNEGAGKSNRLCRAVESFLTADLELVLKVEITRCQEDVDARSVRKLQSPCGHLNVFVFGAGQRRNAGLTNRLRDGRDGREIAFGCH